MNNKNKLLLVMALTSQYAFSAPCPFNTSKNCTQNVDFLNDKAGNGLPYYSATNYDHRMSSEINVYDVTRTKKNGDNTVTLLADRINAGFWRSGEIMTRWNLTAPPYNAPSASAPWTTKGITHGYLEVNIDMPKCTASNDGTCQRGTNPSSYNQGLWPAIWMLPFRDNMWPTDGEIDIMEAYPRGTAMNVTTSALHFNGNSNQCGGNDCRGWGFALERHTFPELAYNKPHTWGFEWEKDPASTKNGYIITGYIDNVKVWGPLRSDTLPADGSNALARGFSNPQYGYYLIINLAVGGNYAGAPNGQMQSASMKINMAKAYTVDNTPPPPPSGTCNPPTYLNTFYNTGKTEINMNWANPSSNTGFQYYQIKDFQKKTLWTGNVNTWTDKTLPGKAGTYVYYISSVCAGNKVSTEQKIDVVIPETPVCGVPENISSTNSADKKNITLNWNFPKTSVYVDSIVIRDWQNKILWNAYGTSWTDKTLPGTAGTFTYFLNSTCGSISSTQVKKDVTIN